jgi:hypothetical protein
MYTGPLRLQRATIKDINAPKRKRKVNIRIQVSTIGNKLRIFGATPNFVPVGLCTA